MSPDAEAAGHDPATLERLVARLDGAADRLRDGNLSAEQAAEVVEQCAQDAAQASAELERLTRAAAAEPHSLPPAQERLI